MIPMVIILFAEKIMSSQIFSHPFKSISSSLTILYYESLREIYAPTPTGFVGESTRTKSYPGISVL